MKGESKEESTAGMAIGFLVDADSICADRDDSCKGSDAGTGDFSALVVTSGFEFVYAGGCSSVLSMSSDNRVWTEGELLVR